VGALSRLVARGVVFFLYAGTLAVVAAARALRGLRPSRPGRPVRVLLTGTFYNRGWLRAHARPIAAASRVESLAVVTDFPLDPLAKTKYACPPPWLQRVLTRAPARLLEVGLTAWRTDADVLIGYHIMPNALICLLVAALLGRRAVYQMTGGPAQVVGGGAESENVLQSRIGKGSALLEGLLLRLVARFDAVVVRGGRAEEFLARRGLGGRVTVIPAGIDLQDFRPHGGERPYDLIFVGRLNLVKGCDLLQDTLIALARRRPATRTVVLGDGPLRDEMAAAFAEAGVAAGIEMPGRRDDVHEWLRRSKVFILTSPDEGLSIALLEAMCAGAVPVVSAVGELGDVVRDGQTGFLVPTRRPDDYVERVIEVLADDARRQELACRAREMASSYAGQEAVSARWDALVERLFSASAG
jgi:glycosyltransferase involved in cell wall biosynthesis